jgi:hypothetical protein
LSELKLRKKILSKDWWRKWLSVGGIVCRSGRQLTTPMRMSLRNRGIDWCKFLASGCNKTTWADYWKLRPSTGTSEYSAPNK